MNKRPLFLGLTLAVLIALLVVFSPKRGNEEGLISEIPAERLLLEEKTTTKDVYYQICCWNLEHFSSTAGRGFPEIPEIPPRTEEQLNALSFELKNSISAEIYLFSEIEEALYLDNFIKNKMGNEWLYKIGTAASQMKTAFVWNTNFVKLIKAGNIEINDTFYDSNTQKNRRIFDRNPQLLHVVFLDEYGLEKNDVLLIGLHLLSGSKWKKERQKGMDIIMGQLPEYLENNEFDTNEKDIVFLGDLNDETFLNLYYTRDDNTQLDYLFPYVVIKCGFIALCSESYPGTSICGRKIDHIIISSNFDPECLEDEANVQVPKMDFEEYRIKYTDHFPVFINVKLHSDDD
jgi:hypothetical protein